MKTPGTLEVVELYFLDKDSTTVAGHGFPVHGRGKNGVLVLPADAEFSHGLRTLLPFARIRSMSASA